MPYRFLSSIGFCCIGFSSRPHQYLRLPVDVPWIRIHEACLIIFETEYSHNIAKEKQCSLGDSKVSEESAVMPRLQALLDDLTITPTITRHRYETLRYQRLYNLGGNIDNLFVAFTVSDLQAFER